MKKGCLIYNQLALALALALALKQPLALALALKQPLALALALKPLALAVVVVVRPHLEEDE